MPYSIHFYSLIGFKLHLIILVMLLLTTAIFDSESFSFATLLMLLAILVILNDFVSKRDLESVSLSHLLIATRQVKFFLR